MSVNRDVHSLSFILTNGFGSTRVNLKTDECVGNALNLNLFECTMRTILIKTYVSESIQNWSGSRSYLPNQHYNFDFGCSINTKEKS